MLPGSEQEPSEAQELAGDGQQPSGEKAGGSPLEHHSGPRSEIGGPQGPEPTRYGDWERAGRCIDF